MAVVVVCWVTVGRGGGGVEVVERVLCAVGWEGEFGGVEGVLEVEVVAVWYWCCAAAVEEVPLI